MKHTFNSVILNGEFTDRELPVLLVCNHMSWWDGIWAFYFNKKMLLRRFHFMMLEEQLRKNWFFKYTGGFSVTKNSKSVIETIKYAAELLQNPGNSVLMFPQGEIQSMHRHTFHFEKGIGKILDKTNNQVQIVMLANIVDYFSDIKPNLTIYYEEFAGKLNTKDLEKAYNDFFGKCVQVQKQLKS
jgi:1-acyl-sn-glycerol-3-phosphate acyltransferase